ncbi:hypothetical protein BAURA86_02980 [Brevibacterium aurantiacum]|uniref:Uncharacterized protein n=1 Tax=Brevibacterium aurantiacum TaxID=273384 RepID=A0A2H1KLW7_BREAU|nr:hypothetical protein BAURA86_02980 [Brevibacterium aurantiacum]
MEEDQHSTGNLASAKSSIGRRWLLAGGERSPPVYGRAQKLRKQKRNDRQ